MTAQFNEKRLGNFEGLPQSHRNFSYCGDLPCKCNRNKKSDFLKFSSANETRIKKVDTFHLQFIFHETLS